MRFWVLQALPNSPHFMRPLVLQNVCLVCGQGSEIHTARHTNGDAGVCGKEPTEAPVSSVPAASEVMRGKEFFSDQLP